MNEIVSSARGLCSLALVALIALFGSAGVSCSDAADDSDGDADSRRQPAAAEANGNGTAEHEGRAAFAFRVENLTRLADGSVCMGCSDQVDRALEGLAGVQGIEWDFASDVVFVEVATDGPSAEQIAQTISETGFPASHVEHERPAEPATEAADASQWPEPIAAALNQAAREGREVVIVYVHAPWCQPCKRLKAETFPDPAIQAFIAQHAIFLDVDAEQQPQVSRGIGVAAVPDVRVIKADGTQAAQIQGFGTAEQFLEIFQGTLQ